MKKLSEMTIGKDAILSEMEAAAKGGMRTGANTNYVGPSNPSSIQTYVDFGNGPEPWGTDGNSGSLFGDSWSCDFDRLAESGRMIVKK